MKKILLILPLILLGIPGCKPPMAPPPPTGDSCQGAETRLKALGAEGCKNADGTLMGTGNQVGESYVQICLRVEREGKVTMRSECIVAAKSCKEAQSCQSQLPSRVSFAHRARSPTPASPRSLTSGWTMFVPAG